MPKYAYFHTIASRDADVEPWARHLSDEARMQLPKGLDNEHHQVEAWTGCPW